MSVRKTLTVFCDGCGKAKDDAERRRLFLPTTGRSLTFDACQECREGKPLAEWEKLIPKKPKTTRGSVVVSEAEVKKARVRRPPRKKVG